ncbi:hypothetical protein BEP19_08365 [Ammoniphilus oxalaticus]|uniref:Uncharacterized protein n=1 Tax=Ammoniphilus oxalaticus TaxID=66863 RepID=A0A419SK99_9BACL|nr:hypothetical protein [Ammoniphilus oxalaticus]RKD24395.1 hypothetical protein BEP19_08365 [Ammoniphilus oxalaticus]
MKKYRFLLIRSDHPDFEEKDHIIPAETLDDAIRKFERKHDVEGPAYWDEPFFDKEMEITFKGRSGYVFYKISW